VAYPFQILFGKGIDSVNGEGHVESIGIAGETIPTDIVAIPVILFRDSKSPYPESIASSISDSDIVSAVDYFFMNPTF